MRDDFSLDLQARGGVLVKNQTATFEIIPMRAHNAYGLHVGAEPATAVSNGTAFVDGYPAYRRGNRYSASFVTAAPRSSSRSGAKDGGPRSSPARDRCPTSPVLWRVLNYWRATSWRHAPPRRRCRYV